MSRVLSRSASASPSSPPELGDRRSRPGKSRKVTRVGDWSPLLALAAVIGVATSALWLLNGHRHAQSRKPASAVAPPKRGRFPIVESPLASPPVTAGEASNRAHLDRPSTLAGHHPNRLPYIPALDGLRALAVMAVLLYHSGIGWLPGGFLGVEVFFVISGYLITSMLLGERQASGRVSLRMFWARRARRLLPAVFALVLAVLTYSAIFLPNEVAELRWDALAAAGYVSNWYQILHNESYFESLGRPSLLRHLWSLAVEEQFYVVWPVFFALVLGQIRRRYAIASVIALAAASATFMAVRYEPYADPSRIYYGTDTRAAGLLLGAALAFLWMPGRVPEGIVGATRRTASTFGFLGIAGIVVSTVAISESDRFLYQGGFFVVALLTALAISAAVRPGAHGLHRVLGWRPVVWIGLRSYSIYLWHWPVFMVTRPHADIALDGVPLLVLRLIIALALAELSYRFVETPFRRGALGREWHRLRGALRQPRWEFGLRYGAAAAASLALVVPLGLSVARAQHPAPPSYLAVERVQTGDWAPRRTVAPRDDDTVRTLTPAPTSDPTPLSPASDAVTAPDNVSVSATAPQVVVPGAPAHVYAGRVIAIGDSVMLGTVNALTAAVEGISVDAAVGRQVSTGIQMLRGWRDTGVLGEVVIVHLGNNGYFSSGQFDQMMGILSDVRLVVFVNVKVPREWEGPNNAVIAAGVSRYSNTALADWHSLAAGRPDLFWDDGIHVRPEGARLYASLIASVLAAHPAPTPEPAPPPTPEQTPVPTPPPTATPAPTAAPTPTPSPMPSPSPAPTPTVTPRPTSTPMPSAPPPAATTRLPVDGCSPVAATSQR